MKYLVIGILIILTFQSPLPSDELANEADWKTVSEPGEEIDFELPSGGFLKLHANLKKPVKLRRYVSALNATGFDVSSTKEVKHSPFEGFMSFAGQFENECTVENQSEFDDYQCLFRESGYSHRYRVIATDKRIYTLYTYSPGETTSAMLRFLESARIVRKIKGKPDSQRSKIASVWKRFESLDSATPGLRNTMKSAPAGKKTADPEKKQSKRVPAANSEGMGGGIGAGSGIGPGKGDKIKKTPSKPVVKVPLRILSKNRPNYTPLARYFAIEGTVRLRVTFNSDGKIGSISPITRLPFGLTKQAIDSARKMRFMPAKRNGRPVGVRKTVAYNFTIY